MATDSKDSKSAATRELLLKAAQRVVARDGVLRLTLDMVAQEAGISKGGILYHYPTKNALITAMIEGDMADWRSAITAFRAAEVAAGTMPEAGRFIRSMIATVGTGKEGKLSQPSVSGSDNGDPVCLWVEPDIRAGMFAAVAGNQQLLQILPNAFSEAQSEVENDAIDPALSTLIRLACDGLVFGDMLGLSAPQGELRRDVIEKLMQLATPENTEPGH